MVYYGSGPPPPIPDRQKQMLQGGFGDFKYYLDSRAQEVVDLMNLIAGLSNLSRMSIGALGVAVRGV